MNKSKFQLGNTVTYTLDKKKRNFHVVKITGHWFGTCTYDIQSIAATTAQEEKIKDVPENFLRLVETISPSPKRGF